MGCCGSDPAGPMEKPMVTATIKKADINKLVATEPEEVNRKKLYAKNPKIKLGYWNIRGLAHPIRYLLEFIEHPYEDILYEQGDAPNFSVECWNNVRHKIGLDFPNMPYMIDEEVKLTDSAAIMIYLCHKYAPELLGKDSA